MQNIFVKGRCVTIIYASAYISVKKWARTRDDHVLKTNAWARSRS